MNRAIAILFFLSISILAKSQAPATYKGLPSLIWPKLYDIKFEKAKDKDGEYDKPIFSKATIALDGKVVTLPGYMVPFENGNRKGVKFVLTSLPLNACFFCGVGGPESVIEILMKEEVAYTEKPIEIRGILRLNYTNPDGLFYRLEQAEYLGEVEF